MPEIETGLRAHGTVVLDASGNGTIDFSVDNAWQRWDITSIKVGTSQASTQTPYPTAEVFAGPIAPVFSQGATWTGNNDTFQGKTEIDQGSDLHVVFTGGVPGSVAFANVYGTKTTER